jgi:hypothetical protein
MHTRDGASLLKFTSSLHSGFRFGLIRHKFATGVTREPALQRAVREAFEVDRRPAKAATRRHHLPAEALSKG